VPKTEIGDIALNEGKDRRYIDRLIIPGAKVYYKKLAGFAIFHRYHGPLHLSDITKSTISIPEKIDLPSKTNLNLKIIFPEENLINMKGIIAGFEPDPKGQWTKTIIQFNPYGHGKMYNSFRSKKRLDRFLAYYFKATKG
jgi:hypothetical protein